MIQTNAQTTRGPKATFPKVDIANAAEYEAKQSASNQLEYPHIPSALLTVLEENRSKNGDVVTRKVFNTLTPSMQAAYLLVVKERFNKSTFEPLTISEISGVRISELSSDSLAAALLAADANHNLSIDTPDEFLSLSARDRVRYHQITQGMASENEEARSADQALLPLAMFIYGSLAAVAGVAIAALFV